MSRPVVRPAGVLIAVVTLLVAAACADGLPPDGGGSGAEPADDPALVVTDAGPVRGEVTGDDRRFRSIPYAAPPLGERRWASPQPVAPWTAPREATVDGPLCAQNGLELGRPSDREDCLTLDVTAPRTAPAQTVPVLVWLHGGSFKDGGGGLYDATRMSRLGGVMVVTVNYRLGALGFLAHPALPGSGDLGLEDQQAALRWVQRNAAAFGGDPGQVTLAGESAGGTAVCAQLSSPASAGLFQRAIVQSSDCTARWSPHSSSAPRGREQAERAGLAVAARLGCADPATAARCLRAAPVPAIRAASGDGDGVGPVVGGGVLPEDPADVLVGGRARPVPVLIGLNRDEERFRVYGEELASGRATTVEDLRRGLADLDPDAGAVAARYPCADDRCAARALAAARTDARYARGTVDLADSLAQRAPVWVYEFADAAAPWFRDLPPARFPAGAYHTAELPYLFDVPWAAALAPAQRELGDAMIGAWTRFARTGDPGGVGPDPWPRYAGAADVLALAPGPGGVGPARDFAARHHVPFWSSRSR